MLCPCNLTGRVLKSFIYMIRCCTRNGVPFDINGIICSACDLKSCYLRDSFSLCTYNTAVIAVDFIAVYSFISTYFIIKCFICSEIRIIRRICRIYTNLGPVCTCRTCCPIELIISCVTVDDLTADRADRVKGTGLPRSRAAGDAENLP